MKKAHVGPVQQDNAWCMHALIRGLGPHDTLAVFMMKVMVVAPLDGWHHQWKLQMEKHHPKKGKLEKSAKKVR